MSALVSVHLRALTTKNTVSGAIANENRRYAATQHIKIKIYPSKSVLPCHCKIFCHKAGQLRAHKYITLALRHAFYLKRSHRAAKYCRAFKCTGRAEQSCLFFWTKLVKFNEISGYQCRSILRWWIYSQMLWGWSGAIASTNFITLLVFSKHQMEFQGRNSLKTAISWNIVVFTELFLIYLGLNLLFVM